MDHAAPGTPPGYRSVTPYLMIAGADRALAFYADVFGARERLRMAGPGEKVGHAEIEIGDAVVMLADEWPEGEAYAPGHYGGSPVHLHVYVPDADATVARAVAAGATLLRPVATQFYGDRSGTVRDPFGHVWHVATQVERLSPEELQRRAQTMAQQQQQ